MSERNGISPERSSAYGSPPPAAGDRRLLANRITVEHSPVKRRDRTPPIRRRLTFDKNGKKIPVSGQDASVAGLQNVLLGKQTGTVYKPFQLEADRASSLAIDLLKGKKPKAPKTAADGTPFFAETPIVVTSDNVKQVVSDGNAKASDICTTAELQTLCTKYGVK